MPNLSYTAKRIVAGIGSVLLLLSIANYYWGFGILGIYRTGILTATFVVVVLVVNYFGPTIQEIREHRDMNRNNQ